MCLNQINRPRESFGLKRNGCGDCTVCIPGEQNKNCKCYIPVAVVPFAMTVTEEGFSWHEFYEK